MLSLILSASRCRTPRSMLTGSPATCRTTRCVTRASTGSLSRRGRHLWSFFLKPVVGQHALNASDADGPSTLDEFLSDHFCRGVGIEKTVPDHLPNDLHRSTVVPLGATFPTAKRHRPSLAERRAKLKIALPAQAELPGSLQRSQALAFPLDEHEQLVGDLVFGGHLQQAARSDQHALVPIELCHPCLLRKGRAACPADAPSVRRGQDSRDLAGSLIKYGVIMTHYATTYAIYGYDTAIFN